MAVSLADLYQRTGAKLGVIRADESLSAEDGDLIGDTYTSLHDQLMGEGLVTWKVTEEVPTWAAPILVDMLVSMLVDQFGVEEPRRSTLRGEGILGHAPVSPAERKLRRQLAQTYTPNLVQANYY